MKKNHIAAALLVMTAALPMSFNEAGAQKRASAAPAESAPYQGVVEVNVNGTRSPLERQSVQFPKMNNGVFTLTPSMYYELKGDRSTFRIPVDGTYYFVTRSYGPETDPTPMFKLYKAESKKKKYRRIKITKAAFGQGIQLDMDRNALPVRFENRPNGVLRIHPEQKLPSGEYVFIVGGQAFAFGID